MNERIKELATQVGFYFDEYNESTQRKVELLAHLIVKRCISQIALIGLSNPDNWDVCWCIEKSIEKIEQHFEVN